MRSVGHLLPFFAKKLLIDITILDIKKFVDQRLAAGTTPRGVNMKLGTLRAILLRNNAFDRIRADFSMLREPKNQGRSLTHDEEGRLLSACWASVSRIIYVVVVLALRSGLRRNEIRLLRWFQIDLQAAVVTVGDSKTPSGEGRVVPLIGLALRVITDWAMEFPDRSPEHYVFPAERYSLSKDAAPVTIYRKDPTKPIGSWIKAWITARRQAGIKLRFHDLRHTAATRLFEAGYPVPMVADIMGWSPSTMYLMAKRYSHIGLEPKRAAMMAALEPKIEVPEQEPTTPKRAAAREQSIRKTNSSTRRNAGRKLRSVASRRRRSRIQ